MPSGSEVDQDVEQISSAGLDEDVLMGQSALLHAQEHFNFFKYKSFGVPGSVQAVKGEKPKSVAGIASLLLIGKHQSGDCFLA